MCYDWLSEMSADAMEQACYEAAELAGQAHMFKQGGRRDKEAEEPRQ